MVFLLIGFRGLGVRVWVYRGLFLFFKPLTCRWQLVEGLVAVLGKDNVALKAWVRLLEKLPHFTVPARTKV